MIGYGFLDEMTKTAVGPLTEMVQAAYPHASGRGDPAQRMEIAQRVRASRKENIGEAREGYRQLKQPIVRNAVRSSMSDPKVREQAGLPPLPATPTAPQSNPSSVGAAAPSAPTASKPSALDRARDAYRKAGRIPAYAGAAAIGGLAGYGLYRHFKKKNDEKE